MLAFVACFDITDNRLRRKIGQRLGHFGVRVQRSVFEISVNTHEELARLKSEIEAWIADDNNDEDNLRFYPLCKTCRKKACDHTGKRVAAFPAAVVI